MEGMIQEGMIFLLKIKLLEENVAVRGEKYLNANTLKQKVVCYLERKQSGSAAEDARGAAAEVG